MRVPSIALLAFLAALSPAGAVTLTFDQAPDITVEIPAGWNACDPATRAALRGRPPSGQLKNLCGKGFDSSGERVVGTADGSFAVIFVLTKPDEFPPSFFQAATPAKIAGLSDRLCKGMFNAPESEASCVFALRDISNRHAIVGRLHQRNGRFDISREVLVPGGRRTAAFLFQTTTPSAATEAGMDAIVASIRVSEKGR